MGTRKGNGIDLWRSNRNQIENLMISNVSDGIYLEQSRENLVQKKTFKGLVMECILCFQMIMLLAKISHNRTSLAQW